jgi:predicted TIM-barrel fold metal-dependent hydrolase
MKSAGVSQFIFSSISCQKRVPTSVVEDEAFEMVSAFGPGAHPFFWVTKEYYEKDPNLKVLNSGIWEGVKIHELETPWVKKYPRSLNRILSLLEERDMPVQFHTGEDDGCYPREVLPFVEKHPRLRVDFAHCRPYKETVECLRRCPNLFTDTAFMPVEFYTDLIAAGVEDRVLFGTDFPIQCGFYEGALDCLYMSELEVARDAKFSAKVFCDNFHSFLRKRG